jgi:hypothetical protein
MDNGSIKQMGDSEFISQDYSLLNELSCLGNWLHKPAVIISTISNKRERSLMLECTPPKYSERSALVVSAYSGSTIAFLHTHTIETVNF